MGEFADMAREEWEGRELRRRLQGLGILRRPPPDEQRGPATFAAPEQAVALARHLEEGTDADHWSTGAGLRVRVKDMGYRHALHTLAMLMRFGAAIRAHRAQTIGQALGLGLSVTEADHAREPVEAWLRRTYPVFRSIERRVAAHVLEADGWECVPLPARLRGWAKRPAKKPPAKCARRAR